MREEKILVIDFGGSHREGLARQVRASQVYSEIIAYDKALAAIEASPPLGLVLTGPSGEKPEDSHVQEASQLIGTGLPILGVGYGMNLISLALKGDPTSYMDLDPIVEEVSLDTSSPLFEGMEATGPGLMDLSIYTKQLPGGFRTIASSGNCPIAGMEDRERKVYATQFQIEHPDSQGGLEVMSNFLEICGASRSWKIEDFAQETVQSIRDQVGDSKLVLGLSGGVDSSVCAKLIDRAVGDQLTCIFVDHGLLRKNEAQEVLDAFEGTGMNLVLVDAKDRFYSKLEGVTDPEEKRKIIGGEFIRVFEEEGQKLGQVDFLAQGTIYPDIVESGVGGKLVKSHHNVGGLPLVIDFKSLIEPLKQLFKDEVRALGMVLGLDERFVARQPFPGPGLAVRIMGEITPEKVAILQEADAIFRQEVYQAGLAKDLGQYFAVLTNMKTVGVRDGVRTYAYTLGLRAVQTQDFMQADWARIPFEVLDRVSRKIMDQVDEVGRVVYDITPKPPGTIEWE